MQNTTSVMKPVASTLAMQQPGATSRYFGCNVLPTRTAPVGLVRRVECQVGDMGGVQTRKALHLMCKAAVLVPCLQQLPPDCMKPLMVLMQQVPVLLPYLHGRTSVELQSV